MAQKYLKIVKSLALLLVLIASGIMGSSQAQAAAQTPQVPLAPGLSWNNLGETVRDMQINIKGDAYHLSGQTFQASEKFPGAVPQKIADFYSNVQLYPSGWVSDNAYEDASGLHQVFLQEASGIYLAVDFVKCSADPTQTCVTVWMSAPRDSGTLIPGKGTNDVAVAGTFVKTAPANGATGINPRSALLSWTAQTGAAKYSYCLKVGSPCLQSDPNWTGTYLKQSITLTNLNPNQTYTWNVRACIENCSGSAGKVFVLANGGTWWTFKTAYAGPLITGNAGIGNATLYWYDSGSKYTTADTSGNYSLSVSYNWSGTITPKKTGYTFTPTHRSYSNVTLNQANQDYYAQPILTISGNTGTGYVTLAYFDGASKTVTSDSAGYYSITIPRNWSGTVTPSKTGYNFAPLYRSYSGIQSNQTGQNYSASIKRFVIMGNTVTGGVVLKYYDGATKTVTSDSAGNYALYVPYNWSGGVKPSKAGVYSFTPTYRSYSHVTSGKTNQNYRPNYLAVFGSVAADDGYIGESSTTPGTGGGMNSTNTVLRTGDNASNLQIRSILSFNTSAIPDGAVIYKVNLVLAVHDVVGTPFLSLGGLTLDIKKAYFGWNRSLALGDFSAVSSMDAAGSIAAPSAGKSYGTLVSSAYQYVNKTGLTQLRMRFLSPTNSNAAADYINYYSGNVTSYSPKLQVFYYVP